ncbi:MAG TPA: DUF1501 domain-containing protein [Bacteroidia bacterium]|jgi:uncharacterized protein (DUF1501 family)|nr:DUF1501 domain-containing protein [Bacteroidia bacterium]
MERRKFFKNIAPLVVMPSLINGFSFKAYGSLPLLNAIANSQNSDHVLVLIQLNGGNDGLNTVIPLDQYAAYTNARSNIAIAEKSVLKLNGVDKTGIHPAMTGIQQKFNDGKIKIVQSVGYPKPSFSHFRATDIWLSAADSTETLDSGWMGRYLDYEYPNYPTGYPNSQMPDPLAIQIGSILSLGLQGPDVNMGMSITDPTNFYNLINGIQDPAPNTAAGKELTFIRTVAKQTNAYAASITDAANKIKTQSPAYPAAGTNSLADQLKIVARLIAGGLKTKVYMVNLGGFDNHDNQVDPANTSIGVHATLLGKVSEAVTAFMEDLKFLSISDRVLGMTFSEFGRRIKSNSSVGTDHGAAAPMFLFGDHVIPGVLGDNPALPANANVNDNIPMQYDFRSIYGSILEEWFCVKSADVSNVLLKNYQSLPLVNADACVPTSIHEQNVRAGETLITNYPNPFVESTTIQFETAGEHTLLQIFDTMGKLVRTLTDKAYASGIYTLEFDATGLGTGTYYARLQNGLFQQVRTMIKVQ